jgi:hypothetical protein
VKNDVGVKRPTASVDSRKLDVEHDVIKGKEKVSRVIERKRAQLSGESKQALERPEVPTD